MLQEIKEKFETTKIPPSQIGPLKLAYLGDAVYELIIRTTLLDTQDRSVKKMNKAAQDLVSATAQAKIAKKIEPLLTEEEQSIFHRGRNTKTTSVAKHSDIRDYRMATGLEALFGYWYLSDELDRAISLLKEVI